jgi:hypothetical protein
VDEVDHQIEIPAQANTSVLADIAYHLTLASAGLEVGARPSGFPAAGGSRKGRVRSRNRNR